MTSQGLTRTRPPWLCQEKELEALIETHNPSLNISSLRRSRNNCQLVRDILDQIVSNKHMAPPCEWEMGLARIHLAVDLQNIMKRWCGIGLEKTLEDSALRTLFSEVAPGPEMPSPGLGAAKMEAVGSPPTVFLGSSNQSPYRQRDMVVAQTVQQSLKRPLEMDHYEESAKVCRTECRTEFRCPYYTRNPTTHTECSNKTFPNPRKLKEHVWRFIKPFKCQTCGEGFGREKTRANHSQNRKTKCTPTPSTYEGSCDFRRDRLIEAAKTTQEMIRIFEDYDNEKVSSSSFFSSSSSSSFPTHDQDEEISSPESQSSSTNDSPDESSDSGSDEYMPSAPRSRLIPPNDPSHHSPQLCGRVLEGRSMSRQMSLAPDYSSEEFHRGKSVPPNFPTSSSNEFDQPTYDLPKIIVTGPEPQSLGHPTAGDNLMFEHHNQWEEEDYLEVRMEGDSSYGTSAGWVGTPTDGPMYSPGYRSIPPFLYNMAIGTAHSRGGQDMGTYTQ